MGVYISWGCEQSGFIRLALFSDMGYWFLLTINQAVTAMSAKTDVEAIRLIGDEVVRLLSLPEERLEVEVRLGLKLIADLARWRDLAGLPYAEPAGIRRKRA